MVLYLVGTTDLVVYMITNIARRPEATSRARERLRHHARCCAQCTAASSVVSAAPGAGDREAPGPSACHVATMRDGCEIPLLGLGTYLSDSGDETEQSCLAALAKGYRHIDTAQ